MVHDADLQRVRELITEKQKSVLCAIYERAQRGQSCTPQEVATEIGFTERDVIVAARGLVALGCIEPNGQWA